jgi:CheY-like chemotaxis protein
MVANKHDLTAASPYCIRTYLQIKVTNIPTPIVSLVFDVTRFRGETWQRMIMSENARFGSIKVLVVDDVLDILQELCIALEMMGFETLSASSYQQAQSLLNVARCDTSAFLDAVVVDMRLGHVSGLLLLDDVKALWPAGDGPVVVYLSGIYGEEVKHAALAQGAVAYLTKPASIKDITKAIMNGLDEKHRRNL